MARRYHLIDDFLSNPTTEARKKPQEISYAPFWVLAVVRLPLPASALRKHLADDQKESVAASENPADGVRFSEPAPAGENRQLLIVTGDCIQLSVHRQKSQQTSTLSATLMPGTDYRSAILPEDWILAWILPSEDKGKQIVARIKRGEPCCEFDDGLRFVGRAQQVMRTRTRSANTFDVQYQLSASGFTEFQSRMFYDPHLAEHSKTMGSFMAKLGAAITELLNTPSTDSASRAAIDINRAIPFLFDVLLGSGIPKRFANPSKSNAPQLRIATGLTASENPEAPYSYLVPELVGKLLGKTSRSKTDILAYADVVELITGVQRFRAGNSAPGSAKWAAFVPDGLEPVPAGSKEVPQHKATNFPLAGQFIPTIPDLSNKPVWQVMSQFLNPAINEMYVTLRVNEAGRIAPQMVVRQMPFSSHEVAKQQEGKKRYCTPFLELPRWVLHPSMIWSDLSGRNNETRFNFIHIFGVSPQKNNSQTEQLIRNMPVRNDLDIQRAGLRTYMTTVNCSPEEAKAGPRGWMEIASDWLLDQHLVLTGSAECCGVPAPVSIGDNLEIDGEDVVYHIEGITDTCVQSENGNRHWGTSFTLTHGMRADDSDAYRNRSAKSDAYLFAATLQSDGGRWSPGVSVDPEQKPAGDL